MLKIQMHYQPIVWYKARVYQRALYMYKLIRVHKRLDTICTDQKGVSISYIDFSCAFDSVTHIKLFNRLHSYGIQGDLLHWLVAHI